MLDLIGKTGIQYVSSESKEKVKNAFGESLFNIDILKSKLVKCKVKTCEIKRNINSKDLKDEDILAIRNNIQGCRDRAAKSRELIVHHTLMYSQSRNRQEYCVKSGKGKTIKCCVLCLGLIVKLGKSTIKELLTLDKIEKKDDMRGRHTNRSNRFEKVPEIHRSNTISFIKNLKKNPSHYNLNDDNLYLENITNLTQLYNQYVVSLGKDGKVEHGKREWFGNLMKNEFPKVKAKPRKTDVCGVCMSIEVEISECTSQEVKKSLLQKKMTHMKSVHSSRIAYQQQTQLNKIKSIITSKDLLSSYSSFVCLDFDYLSNRGLPIHRQQESQFHYTSKLNTRLLCVATPGNKQKELNKIYLWDEYNGKKGANESISILTRELNENLNKSVFLQTDKCAGQLHNTPTYNYLICRRLQNLHNVIICAHLTSGHSYFLPDQKGRLVAMCIKGSNNVDTLEELCDNINKNCNGLTSILVKKDEHLDYVSFIKESNCFVDFVGIQSINLIRIDIGVLSGYICYKEDVNTEDEWKKHYFLKSGKTVQDVLNYLSENRPRVLYLNSNLAPRKSKFVSFRNFLDLVPMKYHHLYVDSENPTIFDIHNQKKENEEKSMVIETQKFKSFKEEEEMKVLMERKKMRETNFVAQMILDSNKTVENVKKEFESAVCIHCGNPCFKSLVSIPRSKLQKSEKVCKKRKRKSRTPQKSKKCGLPVKGHYRINRKIVHQLGTILLDGRTITKDEYMDAREVIVQQNVEKKLSPPKKRRKIN